MDTTTTSDELAALERDFRALAAPVIAAGRVRLMDGFVQHGDTSTLDHVEAVAWEAFLLSRRWHARVDERALVRGALLHDYYLYDWHDPSHPRLHGFRHPGFALANAEKDFDLADVERDLIAHHMWPLTPAPPRHTEAWLVCLADKIVSTRETIAGRIPSCRRIVAPLG